LPRPKEVLDREDEWTTLESIWNSDRAELVLMLGRRRVGKSYLLARFARRVAGIYYQATNRTGDEQLARLSRIVGASLGDDALAQGATLPDWEALLEYMTRRAEGGRFLLAIDEFPYLADAEPALPSILQTFWDHRWKGTPFKVILCGSLVTAMRRLEEQDQPLYGRRTSRIVVAPFPYFRAGYFVPGYSPRDQLRAYGIFGGLPGHLDLLDADLQLAENVAHTLLTPSGRLSDEAQHMLDMFVEDAEVHYSIIDAIANGERTWRGITSRVGRTGGSLHRPLEWLQAMGLVERAVPITERQPQKSKKSLYRITDPYVSFWHRFVSPLVSSGSLGLVDGATLWRDHVEPGLDDHMGGVFEQICRDFVRYSQRLPFAPVRVGQWWSADSTAELDVVALGGRGELLAGECQWGSIAYRDVASLRDRAGLLTSRLSGIHRVHLVLFSGEGRIDPEVRKAVRAGEVQCFGPDELLEPS
jgi:AAA+ ATPase superfamily predicted ATPase